MKLAWIILFAAIACSGCERNADDNQTANDGGMPVNGDEAAVNQKPVELQIFLEADGPALSEPLGVIGVLNYEDETLVLVVDRDSKTKMSEITSAEHLHKSMLTVKVNGILVGEALNAMGWGSGFVGFESVPASVFNALRAEGVKLDKMKNLPFTYAEAVEQIGAN